MPYLCTEPDQGFGGDEPSPDHRVPEDDEVDLEFTGDLDGLSASDGDGAASMEASDLDDDDLEDLGYPGEDEPAQHGEAAEEQRRR